jgi:orotate phosphoribosyltransferase
VITTGRSVRLAIDAVREEGYSVKGVATVIDREENNKQKHASKPTSLFRHSDFKQFIAEQIKRKKRTKIRA